MNTTEIKINHIAADNGDSRCEISAKTENKCGDTPHDGYIWLDNEQDILKVQEAINEYVAKRNLKK